MADAQVEKSGRAARFRRAAGARRGARAGAARARRPYRGIAPSARRDDRGFAPRRAVPHPAAEAGRRQRIAVPLDRRAGLGDRQGGRLDRLGAGQSRGASLDARDVPETGAGRGVGPVAGQSDRLGAGLSARPRPPRRGRLPGHRALAVFERRRSVLVEPDRRDRAGRGGRHHRAAHLPAAGQRLHDHRHLARDRPCRNRQQGCRGRRRVRPRVPQPGDGPDHRRPQPGQRGQPGGAVPAAGDQPVRVLHRRRLARHRAGRDRLLRRDDAHPHQLLHRPQPRRFRDLADPSRRGDARWSIWRAR